jgi:type II restriction enzyme
MKITPKISSQGIKNQEEAFENFIATLRPSLKLWDYFVNWDKVFRNTREMEIHLNLWNYLLGKDDFDAEFDALVSKHPEIVQALPSLIVRDGSGSQTFSIVQDLMNLKAHELKFDFSKPATSPEQRELALEFVTKSGLRKLFGKDGVKNLVDYVLGVEAGLDSNGRKNRGGTSMEMVVEAYLNAFTAANGLQFISQATPPRIKEKWGFVVPVDKSTRRYDFAVSNGKKLVIIEVNFYGGGGSKLKATAGEYKALGKILDLPAVDFVWVTDGEGWNTTKRPLQEAFNSLDYVWNLSWLADDLLVELFKP